MKFFNSKSPFIKSSIINGKQYRAIGNEIYQTTESVTFHSFINEFTITLFDDHSWWAKQESEARENQTPLFVLGNSFLQSFLDVRTKNSTNKIIAVPPTGINVEWMCLCYDLVCLREIFAFPPEEAIKRLKEKHLFQGARYEIAIAAIFARAGFKIKWLDPKLWDKKHVQYAEFVVFHQMTGKSFSIETKSCHSQNLQIEKRTENAFALLRDAFKKAPDSEGFIIFIDMNLPFYSDSSPEKTKLLQEMQIMANRINGIADKMPSSLSLVVFTNFPFCYDPPGFTASCSEHAFGCLCNPKYEIPTLALGDLEESLKKYGEIPKE